MIDSRTNEEIFKEAWLAANKRGEQGARVKAGLAALEAAGRLAGEPSEEKVFDALNAFYQTEHEQSRNVAYWGEQAVARMRAALTAAGVTPQAEHMQQHSIRQEVPWPPYPGANFMYSRFICEVCDWAGNTFRDTRGGDGAKLAREIAEAHTAPVQPSSTVDEEKWRGVAKSVIDRRPYSEETRREIRGLENAIARAVVEAIGGEGRGE